MRDPPDPLPRIKSPTPYDQALIQRARECVADSRILLDRTGPVDRLPPAGGAPGGAAGREAGASRRVAGPAAAKQPAIRIAPST